MQDIICRAGPCASHYLSRKNAKFTLKLSATPHTMLGRCGESRRSNTLTIISSLRLICNVQCLQATSHTARVDMLVISLCTCVQTTYDVVFFAARSIAGYMYLHQYDQQIGNCD